MIIQANHAPLVSLYMYGAHSQQMRSKLLGLVAGHATVVACGYNSWPAVSFELAVTPDALIPLKGIMRNNDNAFFPLRERLFHMMNHTINRLQLECWSLFP